ncbi:DUF551 domain-containing protein [Enterobacter hormaechei subsp. xiangfangensis]|nr:DUF551 domain-containing protein [Enterobacter hormaechei subsp. xiangfangensis]
MGAVNVQVWTSVLGGTLQYETSNGGCTLRVIHTEPVIEENIHDGWVACSERMPEQFVEVLVCTEDGSRYVAALNQSMNWDDGDFFDDIQYVTHWMPLPAAPQQEVK